MTNNRRKGKNGEKDFVQRYGGKVVSRIGEPGPDALDINGRFVEVKRIKALPALLRGWILQAKREGAEYCAFRADRDKWYVLIDADSYFQFHINEETVGSSMEKDQ